MMIKEIEAKCSATYMEEYESEKESGELIFKGSSEKGEIEVTFGYKRFVVMVDRDELFEALLFMRLSLSKGGK